MKLTVTEVEMLCTDSPSDLSKWCVGSVVHVSSLVGKIGDCVLKIEADFEKDVEADMNRAIMAACGNSVTVCESHFIVPCIAIVKMKSAHRTHRGILMPRYEALWSGPRRNFACSRESLITLCQNMTAALDFIHLIGIANCDVKPPNILWKSSTNVFLLCDFGIACDDKTYLPKDSYFFTRYYRAPELLLSVEVEDDRIINCIDFAACDWWGLGITLIELMYTTVQQKQFTAAENSKDMLKLVTLLCGTEALVSEIANRHDALGDYMRGSAHTMLDSMHVVQDKTLLRDTVEDFFGEVDHPMAAVVTQMLSIDPSLRAKKIANE